MQIDCDRLKIHIIRFAVAAILLLIPLYIVADVTIDSSVDDIAGEHQARFRTTVFTTNLIGYTFYSDSDQACKYSKTTDGGYTWATPVSMGQCDGGLDIWYDQWTPGDTSGTKIYIAYLEDGSEDAYYHELDTSSDTLSSQLNITGANQGGSIDEGNNFISITKATDGELYVGVIDDSDQYVIRCSSSCTSNISNWTEVGTAATWNTSSILSSNEDSLLLMPLAGGDILAIGNDTGANDFISKVWDDSGASWDGAWTTIDGAADDDTTYTPTMSATLNKSTNDIFLIYHDDSNGAEFGDDIRAATYSGGSWTAKTDVGSDFNVPDTTEIYAVAAAYDSVNGIVYAAYGKSTTTTSGASAMQIFYKKSGDGMTTWSQEFGPFASSPDTGSGVIGLGLNFLSPFKIYATWFKDSADDIFGTILEERLSFNTESRLTFSGDFRFSGSLTITGALAKGAGTFVIDHPLDPKNKLLFHSFVESPDAKNVYDGVATLNDNGEARIKLPDYFEALNKDFRYQFFPHFEAMPDLHVKQEVTDNAFVIVGGKPGGEISWQVTGVRHDPYILENPIITEVDKGHGQPVGRGECMFEPLCR